MRLHDWEAQLVDTLSAQSQGEDARGVAVYRNARLVILRNTLAATYPVCQALVGEECFDALARDTLLMHPSHSANLHHYGEVLPAVVAGTPLAQSVPYLADVAALEWRVHWAHYAPDAVCDMPDAATLQQLLALPPGRIRAGLAAGAWLVRSAWPVVSIWRAHQPESTVALADIDLNGGGEAAIVSVQAQRVAVHDLDAATATFLTACETTASLDQAVAQTLGELPDFDLSASLATLYRAGWLTLAALPDALAGDAS